MIPVEAALDPAGDVFAWRRYSVAKDATGGVRDDPLLFVERQTRHRNAAVADGP